MAVCSCAHPVAVFIFVQGHEQFLPVVPVVFTSSSGPEKHALKLFLMWRIETMNKTLSCTIALYLFYWILGICHLFSLTIGFVGELY